MSQKDLKEEEIYYDVPDFELGTRLKYLGKNWRLLVFQYISGPKQGYKIKSNNIIKIGRAIKTFYLLEEND